MYKSSEMKSIKSVFESKFNRCTMIWICCIVPIGTIKVVIYISDF